MINYCVMRFVVSVAAGHVRVRLSKIGATPAIHIDAWKLTSV
jgi:hypothetical protein